MALSEQELADFKAEFRAWLNENKPPEPDFLLPQSFMEVGSDQQFEFLRDWQRKVYDAGYLGMAWPKKYGGGGVDQAYQDIVTNEMVRQDVPFMVNTIGLNWAGPLILKIGTEDHKKAYIKRILSAEDIWCQGFSEPDNGSDLGNAQTRAVKDGEEYVINGSKIWTSLGTYASYMILLARTNVDTNTKYEGLSYFLSPMKVAGIETQPIKKLTWETGFTQTFFTDARIHESCLIGEEGEGWQVAMTTLTFERGASGGQAGGHSSMPNKISDLLDLARNSQRGGRPAIEDPFIRDELVDLLIEDKAMELNAARAKIPGLLGEYPGSIMLSNKVVRTEMNRRVGKFSYSLQGTAANYYVGDKAAPVGGRWQRAYFQAFSGTIGGGTTQIQKNILGERVLRLPKS
jgi:alkylation response protein AidB-like acyl-CoA dehydrogenase